MAFGAAPTRKRKGIPAVTSDANRITSGATPTYGAITRDTGMLMAMAATFMMRLVITRTNTAMPITNTNQCVPSNRLSQLIASHSAAPVCHRQKPRLIAPPKRSTMFHEVPSRSSRETMRNRKNRMVATRMTGALSSGCSAGTNERRPNSVIVENTITTARISLPVMGPRLA